MIRVRIIGEEKYREFSGKITPLDIFSEMNLNPDEWLVVHNGKVIADDDVVEEGEIILIPVVSGG